MKQIAHPEPAPLAKRLCILNFVRKLKMKTKNPENPVNPV